MKRFLFLLPFAILSTAATCNPPPTVVTPEPTGSGGQGTDPEELGGAKSDDCSRAAARIQRLGCRSAKGIGLWIGYAAGCREASADCDINGEHCRSYRPDCVVRVTDCARLDSAFSTPEGSPCK